MKIAQVAPLIESVPPRLYGGTERIVSYLTEELVRLGHDVTLFASGDSITTAELAPCCTRALRLDATVRDIVPHFMLMIDKVRERAKEFDYSCHTRSAGVATQTGALPGAEQRAQHNRTRGHGRAFRNLMDSNVGRYRQRLPGWPVARRAGCRLPRAPLHDPTRLWPRVILPPSSHE
jgi:hypothetical protein